MNSNVTETFDLLTTRSVLDRVSLFKLAAPPRPPDATALDGSGSALVDMVTFPPAVGTLPVAKPDRVIVAAVLAANVAGEVVVKTTELLLGGHAALT